MKIDSIHRIIFFDFNLVYLVKLNLKPQSHSFSIFSLQFSVDGSEIICGSNDTCVYIYDLQKQKRTLRVNINEEKKKRLKYFFDIG
jgi:WD40 repeat protein